MSEKDFNIGFNYLIGHFPNTRNLKQVSYAYFEDLKNRLTGEEFIRAIKKIVHGKDRKEYMPKVSEILEAAGKTGNIENQLLLAKKMLKVAIVRHGNCGMVCFEDRGLHAVIDYIGWNRLCMMTTEEFENFLNFQFDGIYKGFLENPYSTSEYYRGTSPLFGQTEPRLVTYASIGADRRGLDFVALDYKGNGTGQAGLDYGNLRENLLIGVGE